MMQSFRLDRLWMASGVGLALIPTFLGNVSMVGIGIAKVNDQVKVEGGSHPALLMWLPAIAFLFWRLMVEPVQPLTEKAPRKMRRLASFVIDFYVSLTFLTSLFGLFFVMLEAKRTGEFEWQFERDFSVATDVYFGVPLVFLTLLLCFAYFVFPLVRGKQTVGCYLMRTYVSSERGGPLGWLHAFGRVFLEYVGLAVWPITLIVGRDKQGRFWYDKVSGCRVVRVGR
jgi:uncharacterized RDD family membrane protein YckC